MYQTVVWLIILVGSVFISDVTWVFDEFIQGVVGPVSEIRTLVFNVFGPDKRSIIESDEPILICITDHAAIPFIEYFSLTLQMEFDGRVDVGRDFVILYVQSFLIVIFTSINLFHKLPVIKCTTEGWDVALAILTIVTAI